MFSVHIPVSCDRRFYLSPTELLCIYSIISICGFFFPQTQVLAVSLYLLQSVTVHLSHKDNVHVVTEDLPVVVMTLTCMLTCLV